MTVTYLSKFFVRENYKATDFFLIFIRSLIFFSYFLMSIS